MKAALQLFNTWWKFKGDVLDLLGFANAAIILLPIASQYTRYADKVKPFTWYFIVGGLFVTLFISAVKLIQSKEARISELEADPYEKVTKGIVKRYIADYDEEGIRVLCYLAHHEPVPDEELANFSPDGTQIIDQAYNQGLVIREWAGHTHNKIAVIKYKYSFREQYREAARNILFSDLLQGRAPKQSKAALSKSPRKETNKAEEARPED